jgi:hypothetical protein
MLLSGGIGKGVSDSSPPHAVAFAVPGTVTYTSNECVSSYPKQWQEHKFEIHLPGL